MADKHINATTTVQILRETAVKMYQKHVKQLRDLDAAIGDGDLGITVQKGFKAIEKVLSTAGGVKIDNILREIGMAFNDAAPSTFGAFAAIAFMRAGKTVKGKEEIDVQDVSRMFQAATEGIVEKGRATLGDKTILDALIPASEAAREVAARGGSVSETFQKASTAAKEGAQKTKKLKAKAGRARSFGERTQGVQDPGATAVYLFLNELLSTISDLENLQVKNSR
jgi:dihydroxyacetone kinase-like protein